MAFVGTNNWATVSQLETCVRIGTQRRDTAAEALRIMDDIVEEYFQANEGLQGLLQELNPDPMNPPVPGGFGPDWERADDAINQLNITGLSQMDEEIDE